MNSLRSIATVEPTRVLLPSGREITIASWTVRFPLAVPNQLPSHVLTKSYRIKPLVGVDGTSVFGELAIVAWLAKDGWSALWADTFHRRQFWEGMPHISRAVAPPSDVKSLYDRIAARKGSPAGCFDVVAWRDGRIVWLEYKGPKDRPNGNERCWLEAAIGCGVAESDLLYVRNVAQDPPS